MLVLLDSTVLIDALRGRRAQERIEGLEVSRDIPCTTAINVEEVVRGLRESETDAARALFRGLEIIRITAEEGWIAGQWRRDFSDRGTTLSQPDCLVAAAALTSGARLVTGNIRDFPMEGITIEHWPVGE